MNRAANGLHQRHATADDAVPGTFTVKVTGHPEEGGDATNERKLTVQKK